MKRVALLLPLALCGCSTAPVADILDWARPAEPIPQDTKVHGGVSGIPPQDIAPPPGMPALPSSGAINPPQTPAAGSPPEPVWPK